MGLYILYLSKLENHLRHPCPENELGITAVDLLIKLLDFVHDTFVEIRQGVYVNMDPAKYST